MAVLGSVAEMILQLLVVIMRQHLPRLLESLVDGSYGVSFDQVVNMGDANSTDLSANLSHSFVSSSLTSAYSEAEELLIVEQ